MKEALALGNGRLDDLVTTLGREGWAASAAALPPDLIQGLLEEMRRREQAGELRPAGIGRERTAQARGVRQACASWIDGRSEAEQAFLRTADDLRRALNRRFYLGLFEFEAQFLLYPPGGFYARHVDSLAGTRNRIVSLVAYLNKGWRAEDGGELLIWRGADEQPVRGWDARPHALGGDPARGAARNGHAPRDRRLVPPQCLARGPHRRPALNASPAAITAAQIATARAACRRPLPPRACWWVLSRR